MNDGQNFFISEKYGLPWGMIKVPSENKCFPFFSPLAHNLQAVVAVESKADITLFEAQRIIDTLSEEGKLCSSCCQSRS